MCSFFLGTKKQSEKYQDSKIKNLQKQILTLEEKQQEHVEKWGAKAYTEISHVLEKRLNQLTTQITNILVQNADLQESLGEQGKSITKENNELFLAFKKIKQTVNVLNDDFQKLKKKNNNQMSIQAKLLKNEKYVEKMETKFLVLEKQFIILQKKI